MVKDSWNRQDGSAKHGPAWAEEQPEQNCGFEGDVCRLEVWNESSEPDAEGKGNEKKREQADGLGGTALFREEEPSECGDPRQHAGHGSHDTQLNQQGDQDEPVGHVTNVSRNGG